MTRKEAFSLGVMAGVVISFAHVVIGQVWFGKSAIYPH